MVLPPLHSPSSALESLRPLLAQPYLPHRIPPQLHHTIDQALLDIEQQLMPIPTPQLQQILSRLFLHYGLREQTTEYFYALQHAPEDLICAAYHHLLRKFYPEQPPTPQDFIDFMQPEIIRRNTIHARLEWLKQSHNEVYA